MEPRAGSRRAPAPPRTRDVGIENQGGIDGLRATSGDLLRSLRGAAASARWAARLVLETSPRVAAALVGVTLVRALVPAGLALVARGLINVAVRELRDGATAPGPLLAWLAAGLVLAVLEALVPLALKFLTGRLDDDTSLRATSELLEQAARLDVATLESPRLRETLERAQRGTTGALSGLVSSLLTVASDAIQVTVLAGLLAALEPLVLLAVPPFALPYLLFRWRSAEARHSEENSRIVKRRWTRYFSALVTGHDSAAEVKLLGLGPLLVARYRALMEEFRAGDRRFGRRELLWSSAFAVATTAVFYALFARIALRVVAGGLTVGDIALFATMSARLRLTLERTIVVAATALEEALAIGELRAFLSLEPRMPHDGDFSPERVRGEIDLEDVSFTYPEAAEPTLRGLSLHVAPGEVIALVGENGAGKTTLVRLIARLYDPDAGNVRLDGVDLRAWSLARLHDEIAFVAQGAARYEATAGENIAFGDWRRASGDHARVVEAAVAGGAHAVIDELPRRYATTLGRLFGERDLSGGDWQKVATARAFARDAAVLILDEPTAHLDARAEYELFCRFRALAQGRTTILVSHRFSTLTMADRIAVLEGGRIAEVGTHAELLARGGSYATLYRFQSRQLGAEPEPA